MPSQKHTTPMRIHLIPRPHPASLYFPNHTLYFLIHLVGQPMIAIPYVCIMEHRVNRARIQVHTIPLVAVQRQVSLVERDRFVDHHLAFTGAVVGEIKLKREDEHMNPQLAAQEVIPGQKIQLTLLVVASEAWDQDRIPFTMQNTRDQHHISIKRATRRHMRKRIEEDGSGNDELWTMTG